MLARHIIILLLFEKIRGYTRVYASIREYTDYLVANQDLNLQKGLECFHGYIITCL